MGLLGLTATGVCSMVGAGINVIPFMIQRNVPGIADNVLPAYAFAALPAVLAGLAYAILASAMPRAGGSYVYASRALDPYLGFVASFSQWFSLCVATGVVAYVLFSGVLVRRHSRAGRCDSPSHSPCCGPRPR
jgi:amino acid transporter